MITLAGFLVSLFAGLAFAYGKWAWAAIFLLMGGLFDILDGAVARISGRSTVFGSFLDSVIDRYSDLALLIGLLIFYAAKNELGHVFLVCVVLSGFILVPYCRAKAELFISTCNVGLMERAERIILLFLGSIFAPLMPLILWILAIFTHLTAIHRIYFTWKKIQNPEKKSAR